MDEFQSEYLQAPNSKRSLLSYYIVFFGVHFPTSQSLVITFAIAIASLMLDSCSDDEQ